MPAVLASVTGPVLLYEGGLCNAFSWDVFSALDAGNIRTFFMATSLPSGRLPWGCIYEVKSAPNKGITLFLGYGRKL